MSMTRSNWTILTVGAVVLSGGCAAVSLPDKPVVRDYELAQRDFPLKSGLRVLVQEDRSAPTVVVAAMYAAGSTSDPKGKEGLAHFVEHLAFRSRPGGGPELMHVIDRMGGFRNAFTTLDKTVYFTMVHKDHLNDLMQLEAWRLARTLDGVTPEVFTTEREVVRNELRLGSETYLGGKMFETLFAQLFPPGHPFSRPTIGYHGTLTAAQLEDARAFVKANYTPDNCPIVISGDVDAQEVGKLLGMWPAEILFGPGGPEGAAVPPRQRYSQRPDPPIPAPVNRNLVRDKGPTETPILLLGWSAPAAYRGNDQLFGFVAARLNLALEAVFAKSDLYIDDDIEGVFAGADPLSDATIFIAEAVLKPGADPEKARQRILDALVDSWTTELGRLDVEVTRWFASTGLMLRMADPFGKAVSLVEHLATTGRSALFKDSFEGLANVKNNEVADFAARWLTRERAVSVYFEPESDKVPKLVGGGGQGRPAGVTTGTESGKTPEHQIGGQQATPATELGADRIRQVTRSPQMSNYPRFTLPNGLEVIAAKHGSAPVAQIHLGIRGGNATVKPYGLASLASGFSRSMCRDRHGNLAPVGGQLFTLRGDNRSTHEVAVLSGNLANGIAVLTDRVACQKVDEESFLFLGRILEIQQKQYDRVSKRPEFLATKRLWSELYPGHPYGEVSLEPSFLKTITRDDAEAFVRSHYKPENAVAVVSGDVEGDDVKSLAEKYLTLWQRGGASAASVPTVPDGPRERKVFLIERPKTGGAQVTQATIQIGCRLPAVKPEWVPAHDLLEELGSDRTWKMREQLGATYGVYASVTAKPGGAADLVFGGAVVNHLVGKVVGGLLQFIADVEQGKLDESTFLSKRWDLARKFSQRFATGDQIARGILTAVDQGWGLEVWDRYPENLATTTPATLQQVIAGCSGKEIVTVVGDPAVVGPQFEQIGLKLEAR